MMYDLRILNVYGRDFSNIKYYPYLILFIIRSDMQQ